MKLKLLLVGLLSFLVTSEAVAQVTAQDLRNKGGLNAQASGLIESLQTGSFALNNDTFLKGKNASGALQNILKIDSGNGLQIHGVSGNAIYFAIDGVSQFSVGSGVVAPVSDDTVSLGGAPTAFRFKHLYLSGGIVLGVTGGTLSVQEATAGTACMGVVTPTGNTPVAVSTTCASTGSRVFYTRLGAITNMGVITTTTAPSGTGFSFASTGASDATGSSVVYFIIKESA